MSDEKLIMLEGSLGFDLEATGEGEIELTMKTTMNDRMRWIMEDALDIPDEQMNKRVIGKVSGSIEIEDDPKTIESMGLIMDIFGKVQKLAALQIPDKLAKVSFKKDSLMVIEDSEEE
jgi:hypothetical protein